MSTEEKKDTLGQRIQILRLTAGLTQVELAREMGIPVQTLRNWEGDHREPSWRAMVQLAKGLKVAVEDFADTVSAREAGRTARPAGPTIPRGRPRKAETGAKSAPKRKGK